MVFKTWFSGLGISTLGPGFSHRGFRVAFGHGHPLVTINIQVLGKIYAEIVDEQS
jgi:hypothetical protein